MIFTLITPFYTQAGLIDSTTYNNYCVKIENFKDFPDYEFLLVVSGEGVGDGPALYNLEEGKCQPVEPGFWGTRRLYAVKKNDLKKINNLSAQDFNLPNLSDGATPHPSVIPFQYHREIGAWGDSNKKYNNIESIVKINKIGSTEGELSRVNININKEGKSEIIFKDDSWHGSMSFENILNILQFFVGIIAILIVTGILIKRKINKKRVLKK